MKLELKHLAAYLPYGLKIIRDTGETTDALELSAGKIMLWQEGYYEIFKPILRPLSDCYKDLNNGNFLCVDSCEVTHFKLHSGKETFKIYPVEAEWIYSSDVYENFYEYLFENHFDIFGLIEQGLAIDINTLNQK